MNLLPTFASMFDEDQESSDPGVPGNPEAFLEMLLQGQSKPSATYKCPYCPEAFSYLKLPSHVVGHQRGKHSPQVVCPLCAAEPGGDPNYVSQNIFGHMQARHLMYSRATPPRHNPVFIRAYSDRYSFDSLWDYLTSTEKNFPNPLPKCEVCHTAIRPQDVPILSLCSHLSHEGCLLSQQQCKLCKPKAITPHPTTSRQQPKRQKKSDPPPVTARPRREPRNRN